MLAVIGDTKRVLADGFNGKQGSPSVSSSDNPTLLNLKSEELWSILPQLSVTTQSSLYSTQLISPEDSQLVLRSEDGLRVYQYSSSSNLWQELLHSDDFSDGNGFNKPCYAVQFWRIPELNRDILICRNQQGFFFADYDTSRRVLRPLAQDTLFPDSSRWYDPENQLQWGYFYGQNGPLGLFARHVEKGISFYGLDPSGFNVKGKRPILNLKATNERLATQVEWTSRGNHFQFADITGEGKTYIIRQDETGLSIYAFPNPDQDLYPQLLVRSALCNHASGWQPGRDRLWFASLRQGPYFNLILLQLDGLRVYQYDPDKRDFVCLNHDRSFAESNGWRIEHTNSILFSDIDNNGFSELVYTGPDGFKINSFHDDSLQWKDSLEDCSLPIKQKYLLPVQFIPASKSPTRTSALIVDQQGTLNCLAITKVPAHSVSYDEALALPSSSGASKGNKKLEQEIEKSRKVPQKGQSLNRLPAVVLLRDSLDLKPMLSAVNTMTGKASFTLPLIQIGGLSEQPEIDLALQYQGSNHTSLLGVGWDLPQDYLEVDYQGSLDPTTHRYYWISSQGIFSLIEKSDSIFSDPQIYEIEGNPGFKISRYLNDERWEIDTPEGEKRVYGGGAQNPSDETHAIAWTIGWSHWQGAGNDIENQKNYPARWYLRERQDLRGTKVLYTYEITERSAGNKKFTEATYLHRIDNNRGINVELCYSNKTSEEYQEPALFDPTGNIQPLLTYRLYLSRVILTAPAQIQTIILGYQIDDNQRQLVNISQLEDISAEPVLSFSYHKSGKTTQLEKIILPTQAEVCFTYQQKQLSNISHPLECYREDYPVHDHPQVTNGPNYVILSHLNSGYLEFSILGMDNKRLKMNAPEIPKGILNYQIFAQADYFGILITDYENNEMIALYNRDASEEWIQEPIQYPLSQGKMSCGDGFIVFVDVAQKITILNWDIKQQQWQSTPLPRPGNVSQESELFIAANRNAIAVYDDQHLWVTYRDLEQQWRPGTIEKIPGYFSGSRDLLNRFKILPRMSQQVLRSLKSRVLQFHNNLICLASWQEQDATLISRLGYFVLNQEYNIVSRENALIPQETLDSITTSKSIEQELFKGEKFKFNLTYRKQDQAIQVVFKSQEDYITHFEHEGEGYTRVYRPTGQDLEIIIRKDEIKRTDNYGPDRRYYIRGQRDAIIDTSRKSFAEDFMEVFLINLDRYLPQLANNQLKCGNKKFSFNGHVWREETLEEEIVKGNKISYPIGKNFILYKENKEGSCKLYKQGEHRARTGQSLFDFEVTTLADIYSGYPSYIAYRKNDGYIWVLPFEEDQLKAPYRLANGFLTPWSHAQLLVIAQSDPFEGKVQKVLLRPHPGVPAEPYQDLVISRMVLKTENEQRITEYAYKEDSATVVSGTVVYRNSTIIPGGNRIVHGHIEEDHQSKESPVRFFDSEGKEVFRPSLQKANKNGSMKNRVGEPQKGYQQQEVLGDGDCGFTAFGITRAEAFRFLDDNITNQEVLTLIKPALLSALITEEFYLCLKNTGVISENTSFEVIRNSPDLWARDSAIATAYIRYDIQDKKIDLGWAHPSILQALAHIRGVKIRMWHQRQDEALEPHKIGEEDYSCYTPVSYTNTIDLLFANGNHFNRLEFQGYGDDIPSGTLIYPLNSSWNHKNTKHKPSLTESEKQTTSETTLFSRNGRLEIAEFYNAKLSDDEADYVGFEIYEAEQQSTKWQYNPGGCNSDGWALTGQNYLQLRREEANLLRVFIPKNQKRAYQAACWVRGLDESIPFGDEVNHFKATIKTHKGTEIGVLPATVLARDGEWAYLEVNVDLPKIRQEGAVTPLLLGTLLQQNHVFQEHRIRNKDGQDCGFIMLGVKRQKSVEQLLEASRDEHIRSLVAPEVRSAFLENTLPQPMKEKPTYKLLHIAYHQNYKNLDDNIREINYLLNLSQGNRLGLEDLISYLQDKSEYRIHYQELTRLKAAIDKVERDLETYTKDVETYLDFVNHYIAAGGCLSYQRSVGGQMSTSSLDAIALLNNIGFYVWQLNEENHLEVIHSNQSALPNPRQVVHMLHTDGLTHFNLLEDVTESSLAVEQRQELQREDVALSVHLSLQSNGKQILDIDHVRWTPRNQRFHAKVYNAQTEQVIALIDGNGYIKRTLYNLQHQPLAVIDLESQVKEITLCGSRSAIKQPKSHIQLRPEHGFHENFDLIAFKNRWLIDNENSWLRTAGSIRHIPSSPDVLKLQEGWIHPVSSGIYLHLDLKPRSSVTIDLYGHTIECQTNDLSETRLKVNEQEISLIPNCADYLVVVENSRLLLWINGQLQVDKGYIKNPDEKNGLSFLMVGEVNITQLLIFSKPNIRATYVNSFDEETQVIDLIDEQSVDITQTLHDVLGRPAIVTKATRLVVEKEQSLLAYHHQFVTNGFAGQPNNVWESGRLIGQVNDFNLEDEGYCYFRTQFANNPLNEKIAVGQPGRLFSISGHPFKYSHDVDSDFIELLFPTKSGFSKHVEIQPHGAQHISIIDPNDKKVALYVFTTGAKNLLTTYEYDEEGRLVKILPPSYHAHFEIDTLSKNQPYSEVLNEWQLNARQKTLQETLATHMVYNKEGQLIERRTPDTGKQLLIYSCEGLLRFILQHDENGRHYCTLYYCYTCWGEPQEQGYSLESLSVDELQRLANHYEALPGSVVMQSLCYNNELNDPTYRGKFVTCVTKQNEGLWQESLGHTPDGRVAFKQIITHDTGLERIYQVSKTYCGERVNSVAYPMLFQGKPLTILYSHNKQGAISSVGMIGNEGDENPLALFEYNSQGQIANEKRFSKESKTHFTRKHAYNSPGYLVEIEDPFLKEALSYTEGSYGQSGYFDSTVASTHFRAKWLEEYCDVRTHRLNAEILNKRLGLSLELAKCTLEALQKSGFVSKDHRVIKGISPREIPFYLPRECNGTRAYALVELLNEYFPNEYGYQYCYGNHMELTKAKYAVGAQVLEPFDPKSFNKHSDAITIEQSEEIWQILAENHYIFPEIEDGLHIQGKVNSDAWINKEKLQFDLGGFSDYSQLLVIVLEKCFSQRKTLSLEEFRELFSTWLAVNADTPARTVQNYNRVADQIWQRLSDEGYWYSEYKHCALFKEEFYQHFNSYKRFLPEIIETLHRHSIQQLGESSCDVEAYAIDENGNHRHYWTGFKRYELQYKENSNQILKINYKNLSNIESDISFQVVHDSLGNVIQAEHKGIVRIIYDPICNKPNVIELQNGRKVLFDYDSKGERVRKRVINANGENIKEILYIRDDQGRSLVEKQIIYTQNSHDEQYTAYLYGPRGLIGFVRNEQLYHVITDHEGSIRLIVKDQEVVAAYDYLPYGGLIRQYGAPEAQISYRYTGQEWDEEIGLYNYHARFYDPEIGRFYQIDPQEQYASPYKYAGNSPISMVDPDGEFAFLPFLIVGLTVGGVYLGGAGANNDWAFWRWDFKKGSTWLGIIGGGIAGGLAPVGFTASVGALTTWGLSSGLAIGITTGLGVGGTYLGMAAGNNNWNPGQWDYNSPGTWSGGFQGFVLGSSIMGGIGAWQKCYQSLGATGKLGLAIGSGLGGAGLGYLGGAAANGSFNPAKWKFTPGTLLGAAGGAFGGFMAPAGIVGTIHFIRFSSSAKTISETLNMTEKFARGLIGGTVLVSAGVMPYLIGSAINNSFTKWDMSSPQTYEALVGGILFGMSLPALSKAFRDGMKMTRDSWKRIYNQRAFKNEKYLPDQIVAKEILEEVSNLLGAGAPPGITKLHDGGVVGVLSTKDGTKFIAFSGADKNIRVYGVIRQDGSGKIRIENFVGGNSGAKNFTFEVIEGKLGISKQKVWRLSKLPNEKGRSTPRLPENCAEPRTLQLAFDAGYQKRDIVSVSAFKNEGHGNLIPLDRCANCQQYVPGRILTDKAFHNPFQKSYNGRYFMPALNAMYDNLAFNPFTDFEVDENVRAFPFSRR